MTSQPAEATDTYPRQQARTRRFRLGAPKLFTISPDGERIVFIRSASGSSAAGGLWVFEVSAGLERQVVDPVSLLGESAEDLSPAERSRRERMREISAGVVGYSTDLSVAVATFALSGKLYVVDMGGATSGLGSASGVRRLEVPGPVVDPRMSPDGTTIAFSAQGGLHVVNIDGSDHAVLASPESATVVYGLADFIAAEELERSRGLWWSPDSKTVVAERYDEADVPVWWIADAANPDQPAAQHRYPAAGTSNARVSLWLLSRTTTPMEIHWDATAFPYLAEVSWSAAGPLLVAVLDRAQRTRLVLTISDSGTSDSGASRVVAQDHNEAWVEAHAFVQWAPDGQLLRVVADPETDTYRLLHGDVWLTPAGHQVRAMSDVCDDGVVAVLSTEPHRTALVLIGWDGTLTNLADGLVQADGLVRAGQWQSGRRAGGTTLVVHSHLDSTATSYDVIRRADAASSVGTASATVTSITTLAEVSVLTPRVRVLETEGIRIAVLFPTGHVPGSRRLPVLMSPYAGPHGQQVVSSGAAYGEDQWCADQGYVVVIADGRGTPGHGPAWDRAVLGDLAGPPLEDQIRALAAVGAEYPDDVDTTRVGIRGWSFGGYLAALAVLVRPDVFHAAVAGAPVTDWRLYDTAYTERYLGHPDEHGSTYDANSLLDLAPKLSKPLLIIHGLADDNVVAAHTLRLSSALMAAGRPHQVLPLSGITHMTPQEQIAENQLLLEMDFFARSLPPESSTLQPPTHPVIA